MTWITLYDEPFPVAAPPGLVYSTSPRTTSATDGHQYFIKGPDTAALVAEAVAYELAGFVGLDVPEWAFCVHPASGKIYFASKAVRGRSGVDRLLTRRDLIVNPEFLATCVAFDIWISNRDRNIGNVVAEPVGGRQGSEVRLYAIDFEKSDILRGVSRFEITRDYSPKDCLPRGELGSHTKRLQKPAAACAQIESITQDAILAVFSAIALDLAGHTISWIDSASDFLARRAGRIEQLVEEAWNA